MVKSNIFGQCMSSEVRPSAASSNIQIKQANKQVSAQQPHFKKVENCSLEHKRRPARFKDCALFCFWVSLSVCLRL